MLLKQYGGVQFLPAGVPETVVDLERTYDQFWQPVLGTKGIMLTSKAPRSWFRSNLNIGGLKHISVGQAVAPPEGEEETLYELVGYCGNGGGKHVTPFFVYGQTTSNLSSANGGQTMATQHVLGADHGWNSAHDSKQKANIQINRVVALNELRLETNVTAVVFGMTWFNESAGSGSHLVYGSMSVRVYDKIVAQRDPYR